MVFPKPASLQINYLKNALPPKGTTSANTHLVSGAHLAEHHFLPSGGWLWHQSYQHAWYGPPHWHVEGTLRHCSQLDGFSILQHTTHLELYTRTRWLPYAWLHQQSPHKVPTPQSEKFPNIFPTKRHQSNMGQVFRGWRSTPHNHSPWNKSNAFKTSLVPSCTMPERLTQHFFAHSVLLQHNCNDHVYVCRGNGQPHTIMGLLHTLIKTLINISYRGIQLLSTSTYIPLAKVCRLHYVNRYSKFF